MKKVTSVATWTASEGVRVAVTYNVINEETHKIDERNVRESFVITEKTAVNKAQALLTLAQSLIDA